MTDYSEIIGSKLIVDESITNVDLNAYFARNDSIALQVKVAGIDELLYLVVDEVGEVHVVKVDIEGVVIDIAEPTNIWASALWIFEKSRELFYLENVDEEIESSNAALFKGTQYNVKKTLIKDVVYGTRKTSHFSNLDVDVEITCSDDSFKERCSEQYSDSLIVKYRISNCKEAMEIPIVKGIAKLGPNVKLKMENGQLVFDLDDNIIPFKSIKHHFVSQDMILAYSFLIKAYTDGRVGEDFDGSFFYYPEEDKHCLVRKI